MDAEQKLLKKSFGYALIIFNIVIVYKVMTNPVIEFDTKILAGAIPKLSECLSGNSAVCSEVSYFPPLQQLFALLFHSMGVGFGPMLLLLTWVNSAAIVAAQIFLVRKLWRTQVDVVAMFAVTVLVGPGMYYLVSSFSEILVIAMLTVFVVAFLHDKNYLLLFLSALLIATSKDTAALWCGLLAAGLFFYHKDPTAKKKLVAAAAGLTVGILVVCVFNALRYGTPISTFYSQEAFLVPSWQQAVTQMGSIFMSPNGGLIYFWLVPILLILVSLRRIRFENVGYSTLKLVYLSLALLLAGVCLSLSLFYSPFGWISWGNRLILPWAFVCVLLVIVSRSNTGDSDRSDDGEEESTPGGRGLTWAAAICSGLWQLPHAFVTATPGIMMAVFKPTEHCPYLVDVLQEKAQYTRCLNDYLWPSTMSVLYESWTMVRTEPFDLVLYAAAFFLGTTAVAVFLVEQTTYAQPVQDELLVSP